MVRVIRRGPCVFYGLLGGTLHQGILRTHYSGIVLFWLYWYCFNFYVVLDLMRNTITNNPHLTSCMCCAPSTGLGRLKDVVVDPHLYACLEMSFHTLK